MPLKDDKIPVKQYDNSDKLSIFEELQKNDIDQQINQHAQKGNQGSNNQQQFNIMQNKEIDFDDISNYMDDNQQFYSVLKHLDNLKKQNQNNNEVTLTKKNLELLIQKPIKIEEQSKNIVKQNTQIQQPIFKPIIDESQTNLQVQLVALILFFLFIYNIIR